MVDMKDFGYKGYYGDYGFEKNASDWIVSSNGIVGVTGKIAKDKELDKTLEAKVETEPNEKNEEQIDKKQEDKKARPIHSPRQVMGPKELIPGRVYGQRRKIYEKIIIGHHIRVIARDKPQKGWFTAEVFSPEGEFSALKTALSMADNGIIPYSNDFWNEHNYLVPV